MIIRLLHTLCALVNKNVLFLYYKLKEATEIVELMPMGL